MNETTDKDTFMFLVAGILPDLARDKLVIGSKFGFQFSGGL